MRSVLGFAVFLIAWEILASAGLINAVLLPAPSTLVTAAGDLMLNGTLLRHVGASIERVLVGFALAAVVGLTLGVVLGWFRILSDFIKPLVEALRPIPPIAWTPLAILWFGVGKPSRSSRF